MAWNDSGGGRDPWGGDNQQGPPDLEEALKKLQAKLGGIFGGGGRSGVGGRGPSGSMGVIILLVLLAIWAFAGVYIVEPAEEGVVTRFGKYQRTEGEGPHWLPFMIDDVETVNVQLVRTAEIGFRSSGRGSGSVGNESIMLTQDENIIDVKFAVQYRVKDARDYLFNVREPDLTLRQATESAVREIVGKNTMDFVITGGRSAVADSAQTLIQEILDRYKTGLLVISVNMQDAQPPAQVQEAFNDAVKAREDQVRIKNEAEAYAREILPKAQGDADAMRARAEGYKQRVIALANGDTARFLSVLKEYRKAPQVTRDRLYLESMSAVLSNTSKVMVGVKGGNNLIYLPLDKLISAQSDATHDLTGVGVSQVRPSTLEGGDSLRSRDNRHSGRTR